MSKRPEAHSSPASSTDDHGRMSGSPATMSAGATAELQLRQQGDDMLDLSAIEARAAAATPGPWRWRGNVDHSDPHLAARGRDALGMVPRERQMTDREAKAYRDYLRDVQVRTADDKGWRHLTDDEIEVRRADALAVLAGFVRRAFIGGVR